MRTTEDGAVPVDIAAIELFDKTNHNAFPFTIQERPMC